MPNWCSTTYKLVGDEKEIQELYENLVELKESYDDYHQKKHEARINNIYIECPENLIDNEFNFFIGSVIKKYGADYRDYECRGDIVFFDIDSNVLTVETETAWSEDNDVWNIVCQHYDSIDYYYRAIEPGCTHFVTNDSSGLYFPEDYYLYDGVMGEQHFFDSIKEVMQHVSDTLSKNITTTKQLDEALDELYESQDDGYIYYEEIIKI